MQQSDFCFVNNHKTVSLTPFLKLLFIFYLTNPRSVTTQITKKPHFLILDGLRGVAAIIVLLFHLFEAHAPNKAGQLINHGYLAVDFFFMLSGFVIGYAYDDRWTTLNFKKFALRRVIRLQPMIVFGMVLGAILVIFQSSQVFSKIASVDAWEILLFMIIGATLLPVSPSVEFRGWGEMHPLNGPAWSLFFEYIANILYGLFFRKLSTKTLSCFVLAAAIVLFHMAITRGDMIGGWNLAPEGLYIGFTRLFYPFLMGLLLSRIGKHLQIKHAFFYCSLAITIILSLPRFGGDQIWINGLYDAIMIVFIFPFIILAGAGGIIKSDFSNKVCRFLGDISYPLYITHYPLIYIYFAIVVNNQYSLAQAWPITLIMFVSAIILPYFYLKLYDEPVRKWLTKKLNK